MTRHELATARGTAAALCTCLLRGDGDAWAATVAGLPDRLPPVLEDAGRLFSDAAWWTYAAGLGFPGDAASAWRACTPQIIEELAVRHDMRSPELPAVVAWLGTVLATPERAYIPAHDGPLFLTVTLIATAEMFRNWPHRWGQFLVEREVHGA